MTQVPASSHGASFNGGTITQPLEIDLSGGADAVALTLFGAPNGSRDLIQTFTSGSGATGFEVQQNVGQAAGLYVGTTDNNSVILYVDGQAAPSQAADVARIVDKNGAVAIRVAAGGGLGFYGHAAQAQQTGVAVTAAAIHAALVNLGLITA